MRSNDFIRLTADNGETLFMFGSFFFLLWLGNEQIRSKKGALLCNEGKLNAVHQIER